MRILVTAGPTIEPIDPVRFLSNHSTGLMGYEIAAAAAKKGHDVILVSGPASLKPPRGARFVPVMTARQMRQEVFRYFDKADCLIMAAAVADFRPAVTSTRKIKKQGYKDLTLKLKRNPDILAEAGRKKKSRIVIGFSLETDNAVKHAKSKLYLKNLDFIIMSKTIPGRRPFGPGPAEVLLIDKAGVTKRLKASSKAKLAQAILAHVRKPATRGAARASI